MPSRTQSTLSPKDPLQSAKEAGLHYVRDHERGIKRVKSRSGFYYLDESEKRVTSQETLRRIHSLVIPPAWSDVWICSSPYGHIQAVGRDAKGRKQYRYHPAYRHVRDENKFGRMLQFGKAIASIRKRIKADVQLPGLPREKVIAAVVQLLESTCMRVGNDEYKEKNDSFGITTLQDRHVSVDGTKMRFKFRGKSGQDQDIELADPVLAKIVKKCRDIPGYELFQYYDENGKVCDVTSSDVNEYIRETTGADFTAKDFRTWGGTGFAALALEKLGRGESETEVKKKVVEAVKQVSQKLGNRPATCRKYYVHPAILSAYSDGSLFEALGTCTGQRREETCVMQVVDDYVRKLSQAKQNSKDYSELLTRSIRKRA